MEIDFSKFKFKQKLENLSKFEFNKIVFYNEYINFNPVKTFRKLNKNKNLKINFLQKWDIILNKKKRIRKIFAKNILKNENEIFETIDNLVNLPKKLEKILTENFDPKNFFNLIKKNTQNFCLDFFNINKDKAILKVFFLPLYYILEFVYQNLFWKNRIANKSKINEKEILLKKFRIFFLLIDFTFKNLKKKSFFLEKISKIKNNKSHIIFINKLLLEISTKKYCSPKMILKCFLKILKNSPLIKDHQGLFLKNIKILENLINFQFFKKTIKFITKLNKKNESESIVIYINLQLDIIQKISTINKYLKINLKILFDMIINKEILIKEIISTSKNQNIKDFLIKQILAFLKFKEESKKTKKNNYLDKKKNNLLNLKTKEDIFNKNLYFLEEIENILNLLNINLTKLEIANIILKSKKGKLLNNNSFIKFKIFLLFLEDFLCEELEKEIPFSLPNMIFCLILIEMINLIIDYIFGYYSHVVFFHEQIIFLIFNFLLFFILNYFIVIKYFFGYLNKGKLEKKIMIKNFIYEKIKYNY